MRYDKWFARLTIILVCIATVLLTYDLLTIKNATVEIRDLLKDELTKPKTLMIPINPTPPVPLPHPASTEFSRRFNAISGCVGILNGASAAKPLNLAQDA